MAGDAGDDTAIIANLGLNAVMIPWFGALGAALASVTVMICLKGYLAREIRHRVGISAFALVRTHTESEVK